MIDTRPLDVNYNQDSHNIFKKSLNNKDPKWTYETSIGFYIGFKGTFVLDYHTMIQVLFIIHPKSPHDSPIFPQVLKEIKKHHSID